MDEPLELTADANLSPRFGKNLTSPSRYSAISYKICVESPNSAVYIDGLRQAVEETCPVYNLVKDEQKLQGRIVYRAYTAGARRRSRLAAGRSSRGRPNTDVQA